MTDSQPPTSINRVVRHYRHDDARLETEPVPEAGPGELLVRMRACGVCSGEAMPWYVDRKCPAVLGHELVGEVVARGAGARGFAEGDRVFPHHHAPCGRCEACRRGVETACEQFRRTALRPGGYCDYFVVPAASVAADTLKIPDGVSDEAAAMLEPLACCVRIFRKWPPPPDGAVVVVGLGAMGLLAAMLARERTTGVVMATELLPARRERAREMLPSVEILDPADEQGLGTAVREHTRGGGVDLAIVCPPAPAALVQGSELLAPGGRLVVFTPPAPGTPVPFDWFEMWHREVEVVFSYSAGPADSREALERIEAGLPVEKLVTHRVGLDGVGEAIARIARQDRDCIKTVIVPGLTGKER